MTVDVLVVGSGVAGLSYAIELAERSPKTAICVLSKREAFETNTRYAQGGIAVVQNFQLDSFEQHVEDTIRAGDYKNDLTVVRKVIQQGPERLKALIRWGAEFDKSDQPNAFFNLGREGGHEAARIVHHKDRSGYEIQRALTNRLLTFSNVTLLEHHMLVDLITDHHHSMKPRNRCYGAYVLCLKSLEVKKINAQVTVLSTGGAGQVYEYTTNPESATGDGIAAAYRAKVTIADLHFVQFHPTAMAIKEGSSNFLISEAVRGFGAHLINQTGNRFLFDYDQRGELASRDIISRAIEQEINKHGEPHVYLSLSHLDSTSVLEAFPSIAEKCKEFGFRIEEDKIPVRPAAHYFCGGISVNLNSCTSLDGLLAIGECSSTGLHGANRLASNSLLEALVYAHTAVDHTLQKLSESPIEISFYHSIPDWQPIRGLSDQTNSQIDSLKVAVKKLMSAQVGVFKTNEKLFKAENELGQIYTETKFLYDNHEITPQLLELRNLVNIGYLIIKQAQMETENKGVHYNRDYETSL